MSLELWGDRRGLDDQHKVLGWYDDMGNINPKLMMFSGTHDMCGPSGLSDVSDGRAQSRRASAVGVAADWQLVEVDAIADADGWLAEPRDPVEEARGDLDVQDAGLSAADTWPGEQRTEATHAAWDELPQVMTTPGRRRGRGHWLLARLRPRGARSPSR